MPGNGVEVLHKRTETLKGKNCTDLSYRIEIPKGVFDSDGFAKAIGPSEGSSGWRSVMLRPRNTKQSDYHVHVYWKKDRLQVDYHAWEPESGETHRTLYAETFFPWLAQFFSVGGVNAHVHGEFEFPVGKWQSKILALPIKVPYGETTAEIEGLSIKLPKEPHGVHDLWMIRGKKTLDLQLYGDWRLEFNTFRVQDDVDAFVSVAMTLIQENKT